MKGSEKEIEVAKSALRWGVAIGFSRDLVTLGRNSKKEQLTFLFAQQNYGVQLFNDRSYPRPLSEDEWSSNRYHRPDPAAEGCYSNMFQAFRKASVEQLACKMLLQSYLAIRPLKNCSMDYNFVSTTGDWISRAPLRIFSDALKNKDYE